MGFKQACINSVSTREAVAVICRQFGVQRVDMFGSASTEEFDREEVILILSSSFHLAATLVLGCADGLSWRQL